MADTADATDAVNTPVDGVKEEWKQKQKSKIENEWKGKQELSSPSCKHWVSDEIEGELERALKPQKKNPRPFILEAKRGKEEEEEEGKKWLIYEGARKAREVIVTSDVFKRAHDEWLASDKVQKEFVASFCARFVGFVRPDLQWLVGKFAELDKVLPGKPPVSI